MRSCQLKDAEQPYQPVIFCLPTLNDTDLMLQVTQLNAGAAVPQLLQEVAGKANQQWTSQVADRLRECWRLPDFTKHQLSTYVNLLDKIDAKFPHLT